MTKKTRKYNFRNSIFEILLLSLFWILLSYNFSLSNIIFALAISILTSILTHSIFGSARIIHYKFSDLLKIMCHSLFLIKDIYLSTFRLCKDLLSNSFKHVIFPIKIDADSSIILISIANSITLTPGTITIDGDKESLTILSYETDKNPNSDHSSILKDTFKNSLLKNTTLKGG